MNTFASLILSATVLFSMVSFADGLTDAFNGLGLSAECEHTILTTVGKRCNQDSLKDEGKNRMNPCQNFESDVASTGKYQGQVEVGGYAGDADPYWYAVTIRDAATCKFSLTSEQ